MGEGRYLISVRAPFIIIVFILGTGNTGSIPREQNYTHSEIGQPYLDPTQQNTTVYVGQTAYLTCVVKHLGDRTVSWIRRRDLHILTSGIHIYTSDPRILILQDEKGLSTVWILKLTAVERRDQGFYECQVNTEPKLRGIWYLDVGSLQESGSKPNSENVLAQLDGRFDPKRNADDYGLPTNNRRQFTDFLRPTILGPDTIIYVGNGQVANFTCIVTHPIHSQPQGLTWYLNDVPIRIIRGGISLETAKSGFKTISKLIVRAHDGDAGKYTCGQGDLISAPVYLRVGDYDWKDPHLHQPNDAMVSVANSHTVWKNLSAMTAFCVALSSYFLRL